MTAARRRPYTPRMPAAQRREQVLDAALAIILADGYRAVSIDRVARELDVTRPVVYKVFDDLDALLEALLERQERVALDQLLSRISLPSGTSDFDEFILRAVSDLAEMVAGDPAVWRPIFDATAGPPPVVRDRIAAARDVVRVTIRRLVEAGIAAGAADPGLDPESTAHALVGIGEYFGRRLLDEPDTVDRDALARTIATMVRAPRA